MKPAYVWPRSSGWLSQEDISSNLNYNWQRLKLYKDPIFSHPLYVALPHPPLKPAPKKQTKKWGRGEVIKMERRYEEKQKHVLQYIWHDHKNQKNADVSGILDILKRISSVITDHIFLKAP